MVIDRGDERSWGGKEQSKCWFFVPYIPPLGIEL
jgi:hypothetical protein